MLSLLVAAVVARSGSSAQSSRRVGLLLSLLAMGAALAYYNLGAKYFPELGYDGLCAASVEAQLASRPDLPLPRAMRDLLVLSCYYWAMLLVVPLRERGFVVPELLTLNAGLYAFELGHAPTELTFGIMNWGLTVLFVAWLLPDLVASVRRELPAVARRQSTARTASTK